MSADPSLISKKDRVELILKALFEAHAVASREEALALVDQVFGRWKMPAVECL